MKTPRELTPYMVCTAPSSAPPSERESAGRGGYCPFCGLSDAACRGACSGRRYDEANTGQRLGPPAMRGYFACCGGSIHARPGVEYGHKAGCARAEPLTESAATVSHHTEAPSCHVCGEQMVTQCQKCGTTTGVQPTETAAQWAERVAREIHPEPLDDPGKVAMQLWREEVANSAALLLREIEKREAGR